jgi:hypothetical protein
VSKSNNSTQLDKAIVIQKPKEVYDYDSDLVGLWNAKLKSKISEVLIA